MKKIAITLLASVLIMGGLAYLALSSDERIEANAMTGAYRTKMRYAYLFNTDWNVRTTWVDESAARQGISTDGGWQYLSVVSKRPVFTSHACGRAPVAYPVRAIHPEDLGLTNTEEIDRFTREFIAASEERRSQMISVPYRP